MSQDARMTDVHSCRYNAQNRENAGIGTGPEGGAVNERNVQHQLVLGKRSTNDS